MTKLQWNPLFCMPALKKLAKRDTEFNNKKTENSVQRCEYYE